MALGRRISLAVLALGLVLGLAACSGGEASGSRTPSATSPDNPLGLITPGRLVVGTSVPFPPFEFTTAGSDRVRGFDIDLVRAVARTQGIRDVVVVPRELDGLLRTIRDERELDVAASAISITPERAEEVDFTDPYFRVDQSINVRRGTAGIDSLDDLAGRRIGAQRGTTGADLAAAVPDADVERFDSIDGAVAALGRGELDAVVNDYATSAYMAARDPGLQVVGTVPTRERYAFAVSRANPALRDALDDGLAEVRRDGTYARIHRRWFSDPPRS